MKRLMLLFVLFAAPVLRTEAAPAVDVSVGVDFFYSSLSPYGEWVNCDFGYGWRPLHVVHGWRPYMYGRWAWTDNGWYWVSSEPFGWATFHYGRWAYDDYYGWIWIPDNVWGPSWVEWRYDDDYVGWAPLSPYAGFDLSVGIVYSHRWMAPIHYWNFIPCRYFTTNHVVDYIQPIERSRRIFGNTREGMGIRSDNRRIVNRGVDVGFVERHTNTRVERTEIIATDRGRSEHFVRTEGGSRIESYQPGFEGRSRTEQGRPHDPGTTGRQDQTGRNNPQGNGSTVRPGGRGVINQSPSVSRTPEGRPPVVQQERRRDQMQTQDRMQRMREQQMQQQNKSRPAQQRETRQITPRQKQLRERPQPAQRQPESRGGRDGRRRG
jgi:hypothetical protein